MSVLQRADRLWKRMPEFIALRLDTDRWALAQLTVATDATEISECPLLCGYFLLPAADDTRFTNERDAFAAIVERDLARTLGGQR